MQVYVPTPNEFKKSNNNSINLLINDRTMTYFFGADSEEELLNDLLEKDIHDVDFYKVSHHGRKNDNSKRFIEKINPKISVITNSEKEAEVEKYLKKNNGQVYYAYDNDVYIYCDGKKLKVR